MSANSSFAKNTFRLTMWSPDLKAYSRKVPGGELSSLLVTNEDFAPLDREFIAFAAEANLSIARFGESVPEEHRNPRAMALSMCVGHTSVAIAAFPQSILLYRREDGTLGYQDWTVYGNGEFAINATEINLV